LLLTFAIDEHPPCRFRVVQLIHEPRWTLCGYYLDLMRQYNLSLEQFMKKFLAIYLGTASAYETEWKTMDEVKRKKLEASGFKAWGEWMTANQAAIVDQGGPLGKTKRTGAQGISDSRNNMTGYVVVQAESHQAAARMFENHPHFTIFPGDSVEIMECLPIPGQPAR
jgi:hypothetical protein